MRERSCPAFKHLSASTSADEVDAETRRRATSNPLMLSMIASIAELRAGIAMPTKTSELYEVAARTMLARGGELPDEDVALLQATCVLPERLLQALHLDKDRQHVADKEDKEGDT